MATAARSAPAELLTGMRSVEKVTDVRKQLDDTLSFRINGNEFNLSEIISHYQSRVSQLREQWV